MTQVDFVFEPEFRPDLRGLFWDAKQKAWSSAQQEIRPEYRGFAPAPNPEFQSLMLRTEFLMRLLGGFLGALGTRSSSYRELRNHR